MDPNPSSTDLSFRIARFSRWSEIFRSWFWRFYDHLFRLILYNFVWIFSCFGIGWAVIRLERFEISKTITLIEALKFYVLFLVENAVSVGWAYAIFRIFIEGHGSWVDVWVGTRKYFWKAIGLSAVSGFLFFCGGGAIPFYFSLASINRFFAIFLVVFVAWILVLGLAAGVYQWPLLFFQNPPFLKILYKSLLLVLGNGFVSMGIICFFIVCFAFFSFVPFLLFFIGAVFFFSFQCVALEKGLLKYKIIYGDQPLLSVLERLEAEQQRGWRDFLKPWENR